jgi:hypothetical protein
MKYKLLAFSLLNAFLFSSAYAEDKVASPEVTSVLAAPQSSAAFLSGINDGLSLKKQEHFVIMSDQEKLDYVTGVTAGLQATAKLDAQEQAQVREFLNSSVFEARKNRWNNGKILIASLVKILPAEFKQTNATSWISVTTQGTPLLPHSNTITYKVKITDAITKKVMFEITDFRTADLDKLNKPLYELVHAAGNGGAAKAYFSAPEPVPYAEPLFVYVELETQKSAE